MIFNTGAALLDAIVLAVVSKEEEGTYGYKITQDVRKAIDVSESTLYPVLEDCRRMDALKCMTESVAAGTGVIIRSRSLDWISWSNTGENGKIIP